MREPRLGPAILSLECLRGLTALRRWPHVSMDRPFGARMSNTMSTRAAYRRWPHVSMNKSFRVRRLTGITTRAAYAEAEAPTHEVLHIRLRRFDWRFRSRLRKLAERSSRLADLLYVFPGAAVALAEEDRSASLREHAARLIEKGLPLAEAARALDLPMWLRHLPPEAFRETPRNLPRDEGFSRSIVNVLPASPEKSALWLRRLTFALAACGPAFALWLARWDLDAPTSAEWRQDGVLPLLPLAAFAWFSSSKETAARALISSPWHEEMTFSRATRETFAWLSRIVFAIPSASDRAEKEDEGGGWSQEHVRDGFCFTQLRTRQELQEEGKRMRNCLRSRNDRMTGGGDQIVDGWYSIQRDGAPVADLAIRLPWGSEPVIAGFWGPRNATPPDDVVLAAQMWLASLAGSRPPLKASMPKSWAGIEVPQQRWEQIWRPYWEARPQFETSLRVSEPAALARLLRADIMMLRRWDSRRWWT
jgi:hypothetical protein